MEQDPSEDTNEHTRTPYVVGVDGWGNLDMSDGSKEFRRNKPGQNPAGQTPEWVTQEDVTPTDDGN